MAKRLAGKRWFEAMGRRARSQGKAMWLGQDREQWPLWAKHAYMAGYIDQWDSSLNAHSAPRRRKESDVLKRSV